MQKSEDAFLALKAIHARRHVADGQDEVWLDAFKAIGWAVEGEDGATLTGEGLRAFQEMLAERQITAGRH